MRAKWLASNDENGLQTATDSRCSGCGYQITVQPPLPFCPMCGAHRWQPVAGSDDFARTPRAEAA